MSARSCFVVALLIVVTAACVQPTLDAPAWAEEVFGGIDGLTLVDATEGSVTYHHDGDPSEMIRLIQKRLEGADDFLLDGRVMVAGRLGSEQIQVVWAPVEAGGPLGDRQVVEAVLTS